MKCNGQIVNVHTCINITLKCFPGFMPDSRDNKPVLSVYAISIFFISNLQRKHIDLYRIVPWGNSVHNDEPNKINEGCTS